MQAAEHALYRARLVLLHKAVFKPRGAESGLIVGLHQIAALIAKNLCFHYIKAIYAGFDKAEITHFIPFLT